MEVEQDMFCFFTMTRLCNILRFFTAEKMIAKCDIFLIFAQNIDRGYMLEPLHWCGSNEYPRSMFYNKIKEKEWLLIWGIFFITLT